jgi:hypothetical protein
MDLKESLGFREVEVLYNILIEFLGHMELVRLIKMCLNEIYNKKVHIGKNLSNSFSIQSVLKQRDVLSLLCSGICR